jgi:hypothetical protein
MFLRRMNVFAIWARSGVRRGDRKISAEGRNRGESSWGLNCSARHSQPKNGKKHILGSGYAAACKRTVESIIWSQSSHLLG